MPSPRSAWSLLLTKEWRELLHSPALWVFLLLTGPLVGACFAGAVRTYAEVSGLGGSGAGTGEAFAPLVGVWGPTFSAYELVAAFLLPFVAIRVMSFDRQSGAARLEWQGPLGPLARVVVKAVVLAAAWLVASLPAVAALALWRWYDGPLYWPELASVWLGHLLNAALTIGLAATASALAEHPSTAAILTLGVTVGTWVVSFAAAVHGGPWERVSALTPPMMVGVFQRGLVRLDLLAIAAVLSAAGLVLAAVWTRTGVAWRRRLTESAVLLAATAACILGASLVRASWDLSESRANSFARSDERALRAIAQPLAIEVHLAPEDARRADLDRRVLPRLRRTLPTLRVRYVSATSVGLFEQSDPHYGEIAYELGGRRAVSRLVTVEGVLETVYELAGVPPPDDDDEAFRGHPLAVEPHGAAAVFYAGWPALVLGAAVFTLRRPG